MDTIDRSRKRRGRWLAVAAAMIGFAGSAAAQPGSDDLQLRPPPRTWPDFPKPADSPAPNALPTRPSDLPVDVAAPPKGPFATSSGHLPPFTGFGKAGAAAQPGSFPQPDTPIDPTPAPSKVWNVSSAPSAGPANPTSERTPQDFGTGWKGVVNQKIKGREGPAAALARPMTTGRPRPEWSWHGYDAYNQGRPELTELPGGAPANAAEMGQYMKYSHLWRPAVSAGTYSQPTGRVEMAPAAPLAPVTNVEPPAHPSGLMTPGVTVAVDATGRPSAIQATEYRAPLPPPPAPPMAPAPLPPKVMVLPEAGGANRLPLSVREKVSQVCAGKCRNLAVTMSAPGRLTVSFLVKDALEADLLTNMVGAMPELTPYKVDFEVQIGQ